jgi:ribosome-associated protein
MPTPSELIVRNQLVIGPRLRIPLAELSFQFSKSSGPGGQHVNKTNSKVQMFWNVAESEAIGRDLKLRILQHYAKRISQAGTLMIECQTSRDQHSNRFECLRKLKQLIKGIAVPPKKRKPTAPTRGSVEKRLTGKSNRSDKKKLRKPPRRDDG